MSFQSQESAYFHTPIEGISTKVSSEFTRLQRFDYTIFCEILVVEIFKVKMGGSSDRARFNTRVQRCCIGYMSNVHVAMETSIFSLGMKLMERKSGKVEIESLSHRWWSPRSLVSLLDEEFSQSSRRECLLRQYFNASLYARETWVVFSAPPAIRRAITLLDAHRAARSKGVSPRSFL